MYRPELHCSKRNYIFQLPMNDGMCPYDGTFLNLEWRTVSLKPEK